MKITTANQQINKSDSKLTEKIDGSSDLLCITYDFRTNKILRRTRHRALHEPGARSLFADSEEARIYVLVNYDTGPHIFVICCKCNKIIDRIQLPVDNKNEFGSRYFKCHMTGRQ